jgi:coatomer subunit beta'
LDVAEECLGHAVDLSGLLLLHSAVGDVEGMRKLATLAREHGKNNVAFLSLFLLGELEACIQLLVDSNRIPEAAFMARTYLPSQVSNIVTLWRDDLKKINQTAAESLADPQEYPNLFPDWESALETESKLKESRGHFPPAKFYLNNIGSDTGDFVGELERLNIQEDGPVENGHAVPEDGEYLEEDVLEGDTHEEVEGNEAEFVGDQYAEEEQDYVEEGNEEWGRDAREEA